MQRVLPITLNPQLTLNNFVIGNNQQLIKSLELRLTKKEAVLYLYGDKNSGKTHILQAFTNIFLENNLHAIYFDLTHDLTNFMEMLPTIDVVLLDNLEKTNHHNQKLIFDLYNQSKNNFNLIIAGDVSATELDILTDLKTRIQQAMCLQIYKLNHDENIQALQLRAKHKNIKITDDIFKYLQTHYSRDLKKLMQMIDSLDKTSLTNKTKINKQLVKALISAS